VKLSVDRVLLKAKKLTRNGRIKEAEDLYLTILGKFPDNKRAQQGLADLNGQLTQKAPLLPAKIQINALKVLCDEGRFFEVVEQADPLIALFPRSLELLILLGVANAQLERFDAAIECYNRAAEIKPGYAEIHTRLGRILLDHGYQEAAIKSFNRALKIQPDSATTRLGLGWCFRHQGNLTKAVENFQRVSGDVGDEINALYALSTLPPSPMDHDFLTKLEGLAINTEIEGAQLYGSYQAAMGGFLNNLGQHPQAWKHFCKSKEKLPPNFEERRANQRRADKLSLAGLEASSITQKPVNDSNLPISLFILGASRSGKTTLEMLLGEINGVVRGYENNAARNAAQTVIRTADSPMNSKLDFVPRNLESVCRRLYVNSLVQRAGSAKIVTNTHPGYINYAIRMSAVLPNVRFVFVRRNWNDLAFRIFGKIYAKKNMHAYHITDTNSHIERYDQKMELLAARTPHQSRIVNYEDMVSNPHKTISEIEELCRLSLDASNLPSIANDVGCAIPYLALMKQKELDELEETKI
jgi:tetratricopeptide (TPR) repeat protein